MADEAAKPKQDRLSILAAILIGLATVLTAWCTFQSVIWSGEQTFRLADANIAGRNASTARSHVDMVARVDLALYMQWLEAQFTGDEKKRAYYRRVFRPDFVPAFEAWRALDPKNNPHAPLHPFAMPEYRPRELADVHQHQATAQAAVAAAERANHFGDKYILATVLFAIVLFFAGITQNFAGMIRRLLIAAGFAFFLASFVLVLSLPVRKAATPVGKADYQTQAR